MAAKDGNDLVQIGYAYVTMGQADKGIPLIEQGLAKGGLKRPDDAQLRLGIAQPSSEWREEARNCLDGVRMIAPSDARHARYQQLRSRVFDT